MKASKKLVIILACVMAIVLGTTAGTVSYLISQTDEVKNEFEPVFVSCEVLESFDGEVKTDVKVKNTGDVVAYIRATFVITWTSDTGSVYSAIPKADVDYSITLAMDKWEKGSDGFYYYTLPVSADAATDVLISSVEVIGEAPEGYKLTVHVAATAIQAEPPEAIEGAWGVTVNNNGSITAP